MFFKRFSEHIIFIKSLTFRKLWNSSLLRVSYAISRTFSVHLHWGKPESLSIEPTNLCNLKCPECPSGNNQMTRPRLFLSEVEFEKTITEFGPWLVNLQLFFQGEPFIHPKIYHFIKLASEKKIYTSTSTNGHFLTAENCAKIIQSGLKRIIISVDGTSQENYEKYRVGGSLDTVISGIKNLRMARNKAKVNYPTMVLQFVVFKNNEQELSSIKFLFKQWGADYLEIKSAQIDNFTHGNALIPSIDKYSRYKKDHSGKYQLKRNTNFKCKRIWFGSVVSAQGNMFPCCFDKNGTYTYDSNASPSLKVWKNKQAKAFRTQVWQNYNQFEICRNCSEGLKL